MEDEKNIQRIHLRMHDIEQPFAMHVHLGTNEEQLFREATKMINNLYDDYKSKVVGLDTASYYAMVCLLLARLYMDSCDREQEPQARLKELEEKITTRRNKNTNEG